MSKTAVIYWSGTGNTEAMATEIFSAVKEVNPKAELFEVSQISPADALGCDTLILGCPAMGAEVLEESEFEPFFAEVESGLAGKNVALFGSYGWGDGEWMRSWEERVNAAGGKLVGGEGLTVNDAPDEEALAQCRALGKIAALI